MNAKTCVQILCAAPHTLLELGATRGGGAEDRDVGPAESQHASILLCRNRDTFVVKDRLVRDRCDAEMPATRARATGLQARTVAAALPLVAPAQAIASNEHTNREVTRPFRIPVRSPASRAEPARPRGTCRNHSAPDNTEG